MTRPSEAGEWLDELVRSWTEMYKKSITTLVLLRVIDKAGPVAAGDIGPAFTEETGWQLTERGLYRTLRRLAASGLLVTTETVVPRTGAKRKDFELTPFGTQYLERIEALVLKS